MKNNLLLDTLASLIFLLSIFSFNSCTGQTYDRELMTPDTDNSGMIHGYNYTALGALVAYPWEYRLSEYDTSKIFTNGAESKMYLRDFMFELEKNMTVKFWFKSDFIVNPVDTIVLGDGNTSITYHKLRSDELKLKRIFTSGSWELNLKDSIITINFGKNPFDLAPIKGKYCILEAEVFCLCNEDTKDHIVVDKFCFRHYK